MESIQQPGYKKPSLKQTGPTVLNSQSQDQSLPFQLTVKHDAVQVNLEHLKKLLWMTATQ